MLLSNLDLCTPEWLELVFARRNKKYGAYYMRQHYAENMIRVMTITFLSVITAFMIGSFIIKAKTSTVTLQETVINLSDYTPPATPVKQAAGPEQHSAVKPVRTQLAFAPVFSSKPVISMPASEVTNVPVAPQEVNVPINDIDYSSYGGSSGTGTQPDETNTVYNTTSGLDAMPQPYGGDMAWKNFMQKKLHYPAPAAEKNAMGNVLLSFVVEKDGRLTNIKVEKSSGNGMDDEAIRVLKLASAWKPGLKNGQPVRVKCPLSLNFVIGG